MHFAIPTFLEPVTEVASHDHYCNSEINRSAVSISQTAIVEQLKQEVENFIVRLFDFVE